MIGPFDPPASEDIIDGYILYDEDSHECEPLEGDAALDVLEGDSAASE